VLVAGCPWRRGQIPRPVPCPPHQVAHHSCVAVSQVGLRMAVMILCAGSPRSDDISPPCVGTADLPPSTWQSIHRRSLLEMTSLVRVDSASLDSAHEVVNRAKYLVGIRMPDGRHLRKSLETHRTSCDKGSDRGSEQLVGCGILGLRLIRVRLWTTPSPAWWKVATTYTAQMCIAMQCRSPVLSCAGPPAALVCRIAGWVF